ncbi:MAG: bifunctional metallophosphatase/5'-nucleotidase [Tsuneonella sp.]
MIRRAIAAMFALALAGCATLPPAPAASSVPVTVRIVGLNDFHGNLEPLARPLSLNTEGGKQEVYAGGAAYLATAVNTLRSQNADNLVIAAGDVIGASPLVSSLFLDEPTIGVMNRIHLDFTSVGNHEFDRGWQELKRIRYGGCEKYTLRTPCAVEAGYKGTDYPILAANVIMPDGTTLFPGYGIKRFGSGKDAVAIGVIGLTLKGTADIVSPSGIEGITFADEASTINALVPKLEAEGVDAIVVAIHQGLVPEKDASFTGCGAIAGDLKAILARLDPRVDIVISGHTHYAYICNYGSVDPSRPFTVTSAGYGGQMLTDIAVTVNPSEHKVTHISARNVPVQSAGEGRTENTAFENFAADQSIAAYVARYAAAAADVSNRTVGRISGTALRGNPESTLGNLVADAQLAATRSAGAQIAFMNPGGVRTDLIARAVPGQSGGAVTFGDIYAVQPFGNTLVTKTFTGAQILELLEEQFAKPNEVSILAVSDGFRMTLDPSKPAGHRVIAASLGGRPIDPAATYRVTMNSFIATGGDGFVTFKQGTDPVVGPLDLDSMEAYLRAVDVRQVPAVGRVTIVK